jgi:hypothetical protein
MRSAAEGLRELIFNATDEERREPWFGYAERTEAQLRSALGEPRECPRFEAPDRVVFEIDLNDGRTAELTYEVTCWSGTRPEPSCGWIGGPEIDHCTLVRVTVGDVGIPSDAWAVLVPKEADVLADETAQMFEEQIVDHFRRNAA